MGRITIKKDGQNFELDDQMNVNEAKETIGLPANDVLVNSRGKVIRGRLEDQVSDGENLTSYPDFQYW